MVFTKSEWVAERGKRVLFRHVVGSVSLSSGEQGIPNGFYLRALCSYDCVDEVSQLDLFEQYATAEVEECAECAKALADRKEGRW